MVAAELQSGSAGAAKIRTCWELCLTVSIPFSRWGAKPFVVHPLPFPTRILEDLAPATEERSQAQEPRMHPFLLAQSGRQRMEHDAKRNKARIAAREGISRARGTQVMNPLQYYPLRFKPVCRQRLLSLWPGCQGPRNHQSLCR